MFTFSFNSRIYVWNISHSTSWVEPGTSKHIFLSAQYSSHTHFSLHQCHADTTNFLLLIFWSYSNALFTSDLWPLLFLHLQQIDKHMPLHLRRKLKPDKPRPRNFEMMPPAGMLLPGQRINVQIKFMPTEEVCTDRWLSNGIKGDYTPNLKLACFVCYLNINIFLLIYTS